MTWIYRFATNTYTNSLDHHTTRARFKALAADELPLKWDIEYQYWYRQDYPIVIPDVLKDCNYTTSRPPLPLQHYTSIAPNPSN